MNNDLISRSALKRKIEEEQKEGFIEVRNAFEAVYAIIDNAPTVAESCRKLQRVAKSCKKLQAKDRGAQMKTSD